MSVFAEMTNSNANGAGYATDAELLAPGARIYCYRMNAARIGKVVSVGPKWVTVEYATKLARKWAKAHGEVKPSMTRTKLRRDLIWSDGRGSLRESPPAWWIEWRESNAFRIGRSIDQMVGERRLG